METIFESDSIEIEKEKATRRYQTFQSIVSIVRTLEIFFAIALISISISWISAYIPTVLEFSGAICRRISSLLFNPLFVFVIGNVIIITLFANSSPPSEEKFGDFVPGNADVDVDGVFNAAFDDVSVVNKTEEIEFVEKVYRRSQSTAIVEVVKAEDAVDKKKLRRSTTVPRRKIERDNFAAKAMRKKKKSEEDEMSVDELNRRAEEFIEKQRKFLSEESKILVLSN